MPLKQINQVKTVSSIVDGMSEIVTATLAAPGDPVLAQFCCNFQRVQLRQKRQGEKMEHGSKNFFPCDPNYYEAERIDVTTYQWTIPLCACGRHTPCFWVLMQFGPPPILEFSSLPHRCAPCPPVLGTWSGDIGAGVFRNDDWSTLSFGIFSVATGSCSFPFVGSLVLAGSLANTTAECSFSGMLTDVIVRYTAQMRIIDYFGGTVLSTGEEVSVDEGGSAAISVPTGTAALVTGPENFCAVALQIMGTDGVGAILTGSPDGFQGVALAQD